MAYAFKAFTPWNQVKSWDKSNDRNRSPDVPFSNDFLWPGKLQSEFETTSNTVAVTWIRLKKKKKKEEEQKHQEPLSCFLNSASAEYLCWQHPVSHSRKFDRGTLYITHASPRSREYLHKQNPRDRVITIFLFLLPPSPCYKRVILSFLGYLPWTSRNAT